MRDTSGRDTSMAADPATGWRVPAVAIGVLVTVVVVVLCGLGFWLLDTDAGDGPSRIVSDIEAPVAPVALFDGDFLVGERTTGRILRSTATGEVTESVRVEGDLRTDGQRGLLGLTVQRRGDMTEVFASWTRAADGRLVVGRFAAGRQIMVWEGPISNDIANGGTLAVRGDDLVIGIGELDDPDAVSDPAMPNGKVLLLDPSGLPDQEPEVLSSGWHNPYALAVVGDTVWVADNAPGAEAERLARIDANGDTDTLDLDGRRAPSSMAVLADGDLVLCGYVSEVVERVPVSTTGVTAPTEELGPPCRTGVTVLADGSIVTTTDDAVWRAPVP